MSAPPPGKRNINNRQKTPVSAKRGGRKPKARQDGFYKAGLAISGFLSSAAEFSRAIIQAAAKLFRRVLKSKRAMLYALAALAVIVITAGGYTTYKLLSAKNALEVFLDGTSVGVIKEMNLTAEDISAQVNAKLTKENSCAIQFNEQISVEAVRVSKKELVSSDSVVSTIGGIVRFKLLAASINIGGIEICIVKSEAEAASIRDNIINAYVDSSKQIIEKSIAEGYEIISKYVDKAQIISTDEAYEMLTRTNEVTVVYTTVSGDSYWSIANANDITLAELANLNPGLDTNATLSIGVKLNLSALKPFLSVRTVERTTYVEVEPKKIIYEDNPNEPAGYSRVKVQGADGQREVSVDIVRINGFETERINAEKRTIVEPVTEIIERGTKR